MKYQELNKPISDLLCNQYSRNFREYRGFNLASLKLIIEYSFPGFLIKINRNSKELRFDIYLTKGGINTTEVEKFRRFYGKGFNIILLSEIEDTE